MECSPRRHASIDEIVQKAQRGDAFFVNRAALNGDLSPLPESAQRLIVAVANDEAARYANDQIIPQTEEDRRVNDEFIETHIDRAARIFMKEGGKDLIVQLRELLDVSSHE